MSQPNERFPIITGLAMVAGLAGMGWSCQHALNADGVAYLRLADYYARQQWDLAVSGYWGPLFSWLAAPLLKLGLTKLAAGRVMMAASGAVFWLGALLLYRTLKLEGRWHAAGAVVAAAAAVVWSGQFITPDLLLAGLFCVVVSLGLRPDWLRSPWHALALGVVAGQAALAKPVGLPLAGLCLPILAGLQMRAGRAPGQRPGRALALAGAGLLLAIGPWMATVSFHYQRLTFTTSARINHAIVGPADGARYHPYARTLHQPEAGRVTAWEDPSRMTYRDWVPWESRAALIHQAKLSARNLMIAAGLMASLHPLAWLLPLAAWRQRRRTVRDAPPWWWALAPVTGLIAVYLPGWLNWPDQRYFYAALPLLFGASARALQLSAPEWPLHRIRAATAALVIACLLPLAGAWWLTQSGGLTAGEAAWNLAQRIAKRPDQLGPVAGSGVMAGGRAGLMVAFHLDQPWLGDEPEATPEKFVTAGARWVIARRNSPLARALLGSALFQNQDPILFASPDESASFPLQAFRRRESKDRNFP